ncbi:hypothetical protein QR680_006478 [Steinernema hermaphroditum]|uniref:Uncharacterized protein n=1 Tax=Steinernema hermaphroditum TaxID=289476 RepID=A0AA39LWM5_9BILA|nr:hypothetical protein QR680_006478 [Steinernema hermaphroditum]
MAIWKSSDVHVVIADMKAMDKQCEGHKIGSEAAGTGTHAKQCERNCEADDLLLELVDDQAFIDYLLNSNIGVMKKMVTIARDIRFHRNAKK